MSVVKIEGLTKTFPKGNVTALQEIDLTIEPGEFVSLIGPSGCGKSTLLRVIGDLIQPTTGTVEVNGKSAHQARLDHDYGIVFQDSVLFDWRSVSKNVGLPLEMLRWDRARRKHGARTEAAALKHGRAHPDQGPLLDDAAFELRGVADAGVALDHCRQVFRAVDDRVVLDVGALANFDRRLVASQHRAEPDAGAGLDLHVADEDRGWRDVGVGVHLGAPPAKLELHWPL